MYPLHALNLNMLQVQGRSDLFLKLEVIKKIIAIPTIVIGVFFGIKMMIVGMMVNTQIAYYLNSYWSGRFIGYSYKQQLFDILPSFFLALSMGIIVYFIGQLLPFSYPIKLAIQIVSGALFILIFCEVTKFRDYIFTKELVLEKIHSHKTK
jgi:teichuronic acid exporter